MALVAACSGCSTAWLPPATTVPRQPLKQKGNRDKERQPRLRTAQREASDRSRLVSGSWLVAAGAFLGSTAWRASMSRRRATSSDVQAPAAARKTKGKVVLLGDSVLDNFFWLRRPERHLRVELEEALKGSADAELKQLACVNLAMDQMTTFDFLERRNALNPWSIYAAARGEVKFKDPQDLKYDLVGDDGVARSAKRLSELKDVSWVVLSLGGNDVYLKKDIQSSLAMSVVPGLSGMREDVAKAFGQRFREVLDAIKEAAPNARTILVIPYHPHRDFSIILGSAVKEDEPTQQLVLQFERDQLTHLVSPMVREMLAIAQEYSCSVVDLSKTFDVSCDEHYGTGSKDDVNELGTTWSGAEPSNVSSGFIVKLLLDAMQKEGDNPPCIFQGLAFPEAQGRWSLTVDRVENTDAYVSSYQFGPARTTAVDTSAGFYFAFGVLFALVQGLVSLVDSLGL